MKNCNEIEINGEKWVKKDSVSIPAKQSEGLDYVIVRTYSAGVFAGYIANRKGQEVVLHQARRLWYWDGAASLSQLAIDGVSKPQNCKFPAEVPEITLTQGIEIISCTEKARLSIAGVPLWKV